MHLVHVRHGIVALGEFDDLLDRRDVPVHRVKALEDDQLVPLMAGRAQQLLKMRHIVVAEDHALRRRAADAFDHRVMVQGVRQDQAVGDQIGDRRDRREVGDPAGCEDQRTVLAVEIGEFGFELHERVAGSGDVARAARADAMLDGRVGHRLDHVGMAPHAEVVVRAPDGDVLGRAVATVPPRGRILLGAPFQVGENPIAALSFQLSDRVGEMAAVAHQIPCSLGAPDGLSTCVDVNLA